MSAHRGEAPLYTSTRYIVLFLVTAPTADTLRTPITPIAMNLCTMLAGFIVYFAFCCGRLVDNLDYDGLDREAP